MKKFFFSAFALVAFSATSFASGNLESTTTLDSKIKSNLVTKLLERTLLPVTCVDTRSRITVVTAYHDCETNTEGIQISAIRITTTTCSDGTTTVRQGW